MRATVEVNGLPGVGTARFYVESKRDDHVVMIPGHGGGREGPTEPDDPDLEAWMRERSGLEEIWYLTWRCRSLDELNGFMAKIGSDRRF